MNFKAITTFGDQKTWLIHGYKMRGYSMKILRYKLLVLLQFTQWPQIKYPLPHFLNWILYMQWKLFCLLKVIKILWLTHTLVAKVYEVRNYMKRTWKSWNIHPCFSSSWDQQSKYYTGKWNLLTLISTQRGLNKTSKINGDGSSSMKWIHWGKIGASGCGNLLLLEWGFVKL